MRDVYDFAKYFIKNGADFAQNTYDGNMKLQKLLVLADMAYMAQEYQQLFNDEIVVVGNGLVVEKVWLRYRNDYYGLKVDSEKFNPNFTEEEYETLNAVLGIYGFLSARELSKLIHSFKVWRMAYQNEMAENGHQTKLAVDFTAYPEDIAAVGRALKAYAETMRTPHKYELINGIKFCYDDIEMTDELIGKLERISKVCEDDAYSIGIDGGRLAIY